MGSQVTSKDPQAATKTDLSCHNYDLVQPNKQIKRSTPIQHERNLRLKTNSMVYMLYVYSKLFNPSDSQFPGLLERINDKAYVSSC